MVKFLELEEYSPESHAKIKLLINPVTISLIKQSGLYTLLILSGGKELKISESPHAILTLINNI